MARHAGPRLATAVLLAVLPALPAHAENPAPPAGVAVVAGVDLPGGGDESDPELTGDRRRYAGDPDKEAAIVTSEDARLMEARTVASLSNWTDKPLRTPYRLTTGGSYTLVLTARRAAYTLTDLLVLAPQTFVRQTDGSYLLSEHILIQSGATLRLSAPTALTVRLASDENGFVSIVDYGGRLEVIGTAEHPVTLTSWDRRAGAPDRTTPDGRAYLRAIGGQVALQHTTVRDLGFWSGRTGGIALTGTDRPTPGALDEMGKALTVRMEKDRAAARKAKPGAKQPDSTGGVTLDKVLPAGKLPLPLVDVGQPQYSYVSAAISDVTVTGNAFGLFIAGANGVDLRRSTVSGSLIDGIVLHRYVTNAVIDRTASTSNGGDGVVLARATTGIVLSEVDARHNARNGVTISGLALASGPSATGTPVGDYGNNSIQDSTASDNGRYGIEVIGGHNVSVTANRVSGNDMGIVVRHAASTLSIVGNTVERQARQGIALRDGVSEATVSGNIVSGGETSIYLRDSAGAVKFNTLTDATMHSVTLVGDAARAVVDRNTISGRGPSAIDYSRATGFSLRHVENDVSRWEDTTPFLVTLKRLAQPLTVLWTVLALIVVATALRGLRSRRSRRSPYADRTPLHRPEDVVFATPPRAGSS